MWLSALCAAFAPTSIGYQDLAAFFARRPAVADRWRDHLIMSPFGTFHTATFSYARPIGTAMPEHLDYQTVNFDPTLLDVKTWTIGTRPLAARGPEIEYPTVNRQHKGDRLPLATSSPPAPAEGAPQAQTHRCAVGTRDGSTAAGSSAAVAVAATQGRRG